MAIEGSSKVTDKGQITIPQPMREKFQIEAGDEVIFFEKDNDIVIRKLSLYRRDDECPTCFKRSEIVKGDSIGYSFSHKYMYTKFKCEKCGTEWASEKPLAQWHPKDWSTFSWNCPTCREEKGKEINAKEVAKRERDDIIEIDMECAENHEHKWTNIIELYRYRE